MKTPSEEVTAAWSPLMDGSPGLEAPHQEAFELETSVAGTCVMSGPLPVSEERDIP